MDESVKKLDLALLQTTEVFPNRPLFVNLIFPLYFQCNILSANTNLMRLKHVDPASLSQTPNLSKALRLIYPVLLNLAIRTNVHYLPIVAVQRRLQVNLDDFPLD